MSKIKLVSITTVAGNDTYYIGYIDGVITMTKNPNIKAIEWEYDQNTGEISSVNPPETGKPLLVTAKNDPSGSYPVFWSSSAKWKSWTISGNVDEGYTIQLSSYQPTLYLAIQNIAVTVFHGMSVVDRMTMQIMGNFNYLFHFTNTTVPIAAPGCSPAPKCPQSDGDGGSKPGNCITPILITAGVALIILLVIVMIAIILLKRRKHSA